MNEHRLYNDTIHGHIDLPKYLFNFIDTPEFQRLKRIKQLGPAFYVFEGACHTRFSHSIGTAYLANLIITKALQNTQTKNNNKIIMMVTIGGLLHDIGHGVYSHLFESIVREFDKEYSHETMSCLIIDRFQQKFFELGFDKKDIETVKNIINGKPEDDYPPFIFELVSNSTTSIDVDKFDYFQRDSKYANLPITFNPSRFLKNFEIINGHIVYPLKESHNIKEFYHTRFRLFSLLYYHKCIVQIDYMIKDIMIDLNNKGIIDLKKVSKDVDYFLTLTDDIIYTSPSIILNRLNTRQLYKVVWEGLFNNDSFKKLNELKNHEREISIKRIDHTKGNEDPLNFVQFCDKNKNIIKFPFRNSDHNFEIFIVRVVAKDNFEENKNITLKFIEENKIEYDLIDYF